MSAPFNLQEYASDIPIMDVVNAALGFAVVEVLLQLALRKELTRRMAAASKAAGRFRGEERAAADAATAVAKIVSGMHNVLQVPCAIWLLWSGELAGNTIHAASPTGSRLISVTAGYFVYDLGQVLLRWQQEGPAYLLHALACLSVFGYAALTGHLQYYGAAFLLWELSTPCVHARWFLFKAGMEDTRLYLANGLAMTATFFAARCVWGTYASARFWAATQAELAAAGGAGAESAMSPGVVWGARMANVALNALNFYWFALMARKAAAVVLGGRRMSEVHTGKEA